MLMEAKTHPRINDVHGRSLEAGLERSNKLGQHGTQQVWAKLLIIIFETGNCTVL